MQIYAQVLHATRNLGEALTNLRHVLRAGGLLVLSEITEIRETALADSTWGLTDGWWLFNDGRIFAPQSREQWGDWFISTGFDLVSGATQPELGYASALDGQTVFVARAQFPKTIGRLPTCTLGSTWGRFIVTGGLGGVGLATSQWLVECHGVCSVIMTSRTGTTKDAVDLTKLAIMHHYERAVVQAAACDVTCLDQVQSLLVQGRQQGGGLPLGGIVHSVGVLSDAMIENQTISAFQQVLAPKVDGAMHLHMSALLHPLQCFVVYSSIAGVIG